MVPSKLRTAEMSKKQTTDLLLVAEWPRCLLRCLAALLAFSFLASCGALREGMV